MKVKRMITALPAATAEAVERFRIARGIDSLSTAMRVLIETALTEHERAESLETARLWLFGRPA